MKSPSPESLKIVIREMKDADGYVYSTHMVTGRDPEGRRLRKCFKERRQAEAFIVGMRTKLLNAETGVNSVLTRLTAGQTREAEAAFAALGKRYTLDQAVRYFLANYATPDKVVTMEKAVESFLEGKPTEDGIRAATMATTRSTLNRFRDYLGKDKPVHEVTATEVADFLKTLRAKDGIAPATKKTFNNCRNDISGFFEWCMEEDPKHRRRWLAKNPAREIKLYSTEQVKRAGRPDILTTEQALKLMRAATKNEPCLAATYALMLFAGIRPDNQRGEIYKLSKSPEQINLATNKIHVEAGDSKVKGWRDVDISQNLRLWLEAYPGVVLPRNAKRVMDRFRALQKLTPDVCRHTFCTNHVTEHGSFADTAMQSGNSETILRQHYVNRISKDEAAKFWRIVPDKKHGAIIAPVQAPASSGDAKKKEPAKKAPAKRRR